MTDYLMLLLEEQEDGSDEQENDWSELDRRRPRAERLRRGRTADEGETPAPEGVENAGPDGAERAHLPAETLVGSLRAVDRREAQLEQASLRRREALPEEIGRRADSGADWLNSRLHRVLARESAGRQSLPDPAPVRTDRPEEFRLPGPEELDRLFQQDARRYDGAFTFY